MVKAKRKPLEEIKQAIQDYTRVLNVGCGGCVSVCLAGGQSLQRRVHALLQGPPGPGNPFQSQMQDHTGC